MQETEMVLLTTAQLRYREADYFYTQFLAHCGPPHDSYFQMVCYFDSFLFALTSVEEMVDTSSKATLRDVEVFRFIKALRNITMHHSVLAAPQPGAKLVRPFSRQISESVGGIQSSSAKLAIKYSNFREIFDYIEVKRPSEKRTLDVARDYLAKLEAGSQPVYLETVLYDALQKVAKLIAF